MLYRIGYIEQMVTGIIRMRQAAKEANVAAPIFAVSEFFKVTFLRSDAPSLAASDGSALEHRLTSDGSAMDQRWISDGAE